MRIIFAIAFSVLFSSPALCKGNKQVQELLALTPEVVARKIIIKNDDLEPVVSISSEAVWTEKRGILKVVSNDNFLRAFVDKKTGDTKIQIYDFIAYYGDWRHYNRVNYEVPNGMETANIDSLSEDVVSCANSDILGGCRLVEHVVFEIPQELFSGVSYSEKEPKAWNYRLKSKSGKDWNSFLIASEVVGFLQVVDRMKKQYTPKKP